MQADRFQKGQSPCDDYWRDISNVQAATHLRISSMCTIKLKGQKLQHHRVMHHHSCPLTSAHLIDHVSIHLHLDRCTTIKHSRSISHLLSLPCTLLIAARIAGVVISLSAALYFFLLCTIRPSTPHLLSTGPPSIICSPQEPPIVSAHDRSPLNASYLYFFCC